MGRRPCVCTNGRALPPAQERADVRPVPTPYGSPARPWLVRHGSQGTLSASLGEVLLSGLWSRQSALGRATGRSPRAEALPYLPHVQIEPNITAVCSDLV